MTEPPHTEGEDQRPDRPDPPSWPAQPPEQQEMPQQQSQAQHPGQSEPGHPGSPRPGDEGTAQDPWAYPWGDQSQGSREPWGPPRDAGTPASAGASAQPAAAWAQPSAAAQPPAAAAQPSPAPAAAPQPYPQQPYPQQPYPPSYGQQPYPPSYGQQPTRYGQPTGEPPVPLPSSTIVLLVVSALATFSGILTLAGIAPLILSIVAMTRNRTDTAGARRLTRIGWIVLVVVALVLVLAVVGSVALLVTTSP